ncbi:MAG: alpha-1,2-fucosyltransferase, partial [Selenomonadaceae bacterium]|nr:alpha-1,2-fucosyltransferase [Selenomonadaceae bacterium]
CKEYLKFDVPTEFVEGCEHDFEEMHLMSLCKHNIISNSTFAWWGAWLNKNPDKKVFAPDTWFASNPKIAIVPESWIKIPAAYNLLTPPMLSVIIYSEVPPSNSSITLKCILAQTSKDYEIIFINPSQDDAEKIYQHKVKGVKFSVLAVNNFKNKFESLNKGLSVARGDYVLFLTDKEFILPYTSKMLSDICSSSIFIYADNRRTHLTYANFTDYLPDIVSSTQIFVEDADGNVVIEELPGKKFVKKTDPALVELKQMAELNLDAEQKLMGLATQGINNSVDTKFFKRKFLAENKIAFKGKGGVRTRSYSLQLKHFWRRTKLLSCRRFSAVGLNEF